jgi:hypothetical protein
MMCSTASIHIANHTVALLYCTLRYSGSSPRNPPQFLTLVVGAVNAWNLAALLTLSFALSMTVVLGPTNP